MFLKLTFTVDMLIELTYLLINTTNCVTMGTAINKKNIRKRCWAKKIRGVRGLAGRIRKSRQAIYFALENPRRYPVVFNLIQEALQ